MSVPGLHHGPVRLEAITWELLGERIAERIDRGGTRDGGPWVRVAVDGAAEAGPGEFAARLAEALRLRGRSVLPVASGGFLRPASLRLEYGKRDPDAYYDLWQDTGALWREVFDPLEPGGSGRVLPDLWDPALDRATRSARVPLQEGGVLLLYGEFLLGKWFPFDMAVHLRMSAAALERRLPEERRWTLPAFERYEEEAAPGDAADIVIATDRPGRPAWSG